MSDLKKRANELLLSGWAVVKKIDAIIAKDRKNAEAFRQRNFPSVRDAVHILSREDLPQVINELADTNSLLNKERLKLLTFFNQNGEALLNEDPSAYKSLDDLFENMNSRGEYTLRSEAWHRAANLKPISERVQESSAKLATGVSETFKNLPKTAAIVLIVTGVVVLVGLFEKVRR